ncbi:hypothetical protein [Vagococcus zengguangii]|uniref:hypothetical protein n=1 Tax=Vagococcus zengguangii TaxID=2571750 RepID=UPI001108EEE2|nr:hypothetical protein [Vagococcus zengguangii]TLG80928.1 hypothetical protein FE258_03305 [Vagococcus zengguangii]
MKKTTGLTMIALLLLSTPLKAFSYQNQETVVQSVESTNQVDNVSTESFTKETFEIKATTESETITEDSEIESVSDSSLSKEVPTSESVLTEEDTTNDSSTIEKETFGVVALTDYYVTLIDGETKIYSNLSDSFFHKNGQPIDEYYMKTVKLTERHSNNQGIEGYTALNSKGEFIGYLDGAAWEPFPAQGRKLSLPSKIKVNVTSKAYPSYKDFKWTKLHTATDLANKTFEVQEYYNHYNDSTYYGLYSGGTFYGYINKKATTVVTDNAKPQGDYITYGLYNIWC